MNRRFSDTVAAVAVCVCLLGFATIVAAQDNPFAAAENPLAGSRTWTDSTGQFKIVAEFIEFKSGQVSLKTENGRVIQLPLARLSATDQKLVQSATAATPAPPTAPVPAKTVQMKAKPIWSLTPSPPAVPQQELVDRPIMLSEHLGHPFFEGIRVIGFNRVGGQAFVLRSSRDGAELTLRVERVDLASGKTMGTVTYPEKTEILSVDPKGEKLATRPDVGYGKNDRIDLWDVTGLEPKVTSSFQPFAETTAARKDVGTATFVGADHMLVVAAHGEIVLWNISEKKHVYFFKAEGEPAVSANGKFLAAATPQGMFVYDVMTGNPLGKLAGDQGKFMKFAFSPDGRYLAMYAQGGRLQVWDCTVGERIRDLHLTNIEKANHIDWVGDGYVMLRYVGPSFLVDVNRRVVYWKYEGIKDGMMLGNRFWSVVGLGEGKALFPGRFPHAAALRAVALPPADKLLVLKPGSTVRLEVLSPAAPEHQSKIEQTLAARLEENGIKRSASAKLVLEAASEKGEMRSITFRGLGVSRGSETVQVKEQIYRLTLKRDGKILWQTSQVLAAPRLLRLESGQTIQDALKVYTNPDVKFFIETPLPRLIAELGPHDGAYGVSKIDAQGIR